MIRTITGCVLGVAIIAALPARADIVFDTGGFEAYNLGAVAGQHNWQNDSSASQPAPTIYEDAFTMQGTKPHNKVLKVDPSSLSTNDYSGAFLPFGQNLITPGTKKLTITFDQFRGTLSQAAFILEAPGSRVNSSWLGYEYPLDVNPSFYPTGVVSDAGVPLAAGQWQTVNIMLDLDKQEVSASVDGVFPAINPQPIGLPALTEFSGIGFRVYGTNRGTPNGPNYVDNLVVTGTSEVPEPTSLVLMATALGPILLKRRRKA